MKRGVVKKYIVLGIMMLFIGTCWFPNHIIKARGNDSNIIEMGFLDSPPTAPMDTSDTIVEREIVLTESFSAVILDNVPTSKWTYGCGPTSAGMLFGYYDRKGYKNMYTGPANGGICPHVDLGQGTPGAGNGYPISGSCYIIATEKDLDGITTKAHVDDYWISIGSPGPDPWEGNWAEHTWSLCVADFIGGSQWKWDSNVDGIKDRNTDGSTVIFYNTGGSILYDFLPPAEQGLPRTALCHGMRLFAESRGYTVSNNYVQLTDTSYGHPSGFTFNDFKGEINVGRPVGTFWVTSSGSGHFMLGVGYDSSANTIFIHDTWDNNLHEVNWDGSYADFNLKAAVVIQLAASGNQCPDTPDAPEGATSCNVSHEYTYSTRTTDPNGNQVKYGWDWTSDGTVDEWTSFYSSGSIVNTSHTWTSPGTYNIQVKAMDVGDAMSDWSDVLTVNVIDNRPTPPSISGQTNGKINTEYIYSFDSSDPTEDDVSFYIEWGDGIITDWTEFYPPGTPGYSESHSWATKGTYTIRAKAIDINGDESDWGQLTVTMPFSYEPQFPFISWLLERFPNGFPLLRHLLGY